MAALSQTASSVVFSATGLANIGPVRTAGATIAKGQPCYYDSTAGTIKLMGAAVSGIASVTEFGLAAYGAASGQQIQLIAVDPACVVGATMSPGFPIQVHTTAGSITQTQADLSSTNVGITCGPAVSATVLNLNMKIGGALT